MQRWTFRAGLQWGPQVQRAQPAHFTAGRGRQVWQKGWSSGAHGAGAGLRPVPLEQGQPTGVSQIEPSCQLWGTARDNHYIGLFTWPKELL